MQTEIAALNGCAPAGEHVVSLLNKAWLVAVQQIALQTALESVDQYEARELIDLWDAGHLAPAFDGDLVFAYLVAFENKIKAAIASGDLETLADIAAFASANHYPSLEAKAKTGLE